MLMLQGGNLARYYVPKLDVEVRFIIYLYGQNQRLVVSDIDGFQYGLVITTAELVTDVRLPTAVLPLHYQVRLIPDFEATEGSRIRYDGNVEMFVEVVAETPIFTFHMDELTPDTEWLLQDDPPMVQKQEADGSILNVTVSRITFDFQRTFVHLELEEGWEVGYEMECWGGRGKGRRRG